VTSEQLHLQHTKPYPAELDDDDHDDNDYDDDDDDDDEK
jgi:hypothetical protein